MKFAELNPYGRAYMAAFLGMSGIATFYLIGQNFISLLNILSPLLFEALSFILFTSAFLIARRYGWSLRGIISRIWVTASLAAILAFTGITCWNLEVYVGFTSPQPSASHLFLLSALALSTYALSVYVKTFKEALRGRILTVVTFSILLSGFTTAYLVVLPILSTRLGLAFILTKEKIFLYPCYLMASLGFIPLAAPLETFLLVGSWLLPAWLSTFACYYGGLTLPQFQWGGFVAAQVFIALVCGLKNLGLTGKALKRVLLLLLCLSLASASLLSPFGLGMLRSDFKKPTPGEHEQILSEMVSMIPPEASVLTQNHIFPHLCNRLEAYVWPVFPKILKKPPAYAQNTEYVLLDLSRAGFSMADYLFNLIEKGEYGVLAAADYVILLKKGYHGPPLNLNLTHGLLMRIYREPHPAGKPILEMPVVNASLASVILPSQNGCIELEGYLYTPSAGLYKFRVDSTDKFAFNLDGLESEAPTIQVYLQQGYHKIRILWYPEAERSHLNLCWKKPQTERYEAVSPKYLSPKTW